MTAVNRFIVAQCKINVPTSVTRSHCRCIDLGCSRFKERQATHHLTQPTSPVISNLHDHRSGLSSSLDKRDVTYDAGAHLANSRLL